MKDDGARRERAGLRAIVVESVAGITQHPGRSAMTALGTVIGVTVLLAVLALTTSASLQVSKAFDLQEATLVRVAQQPEHPTKVANLLFTLDSPRAAEGLPGVEEAALSWQFQQIKAAYRGRSTASPVVAATPGYSEVAVAEFVVGRSFDEGHQERDSRVAVLGSGAASDLGITDLTQQPAIQIQGAPFTVVGIIKDTRRMPELLGSVIIPASTAMSLWPAPSGDEDPTLSVSVVPGAATVVGAQLPLALSATSPDEYVVQLPPDPQGLRQSVDQQLQVLFIALAGVCLVIGVIGIANTTFIAVVERTGEIGLRRAMGASRLDIASQFILEAGLLGGLGGCIGTAIGTLAVVVTSAALGWTAVIPPALVAVGPLIGVASGALGGLLPAVRASSLEPSDALRQ